MGRCYAVELTVKVKDDAGFVRRSRKVLDGLNIREDCFAGADMTTPEGNVKFVLAGNTQPEGYKADYNEGGWREYANAFDASYSWDGVMEEWFRAVAPTLEVGSRIEVWPDYGSWGCQVGINGGIVKTITEEPEEEEEE